MITFFDRYSLQAPKEGARIGSRVKKRMRSDTIRPDMKWYQRITVGQYIIIALALVTVQILVMLYQGHTMICECGFVRFWHGALNTSEDSQHFTDWYTFSHFIHGIIFYWILRKVSGKRWPIWLCFVFAIGIEVGWEILENSPLIINRYRNYTAALQYYGDSILNSLSDVLFMCIGFIVAWRAPVWLSIALIIGLELFVGYMIRDNLTLNVLMLVTPLESIKEWQLGG